MLQNVSLTLSLCRGALFLESKGPEWPLEVMIKWRQLCEARPEYDVTGTVTFGGSGVIKDGRRPVLRLDGLTAGRLPPGRYIAMITVTAQNRSRVGAERRSAALKMAPHGASIVPEKASNADQQQNGSQNDQEQQATKYQIEPDTDEFSE